MLDNSSTAYLVLKSSFLLHFSALILFFKGRNFGLLALLEQKLVDFEGNCET